jgi:hypothetical protein
MKKDSKNYGEQKYRKKEKAWNVKNRKKRGYSRKWKIDENSL